MAEIGELEVLGEGESRLFYFPCVILEAGFARKAIEANELPLFVDQALKAMELSGQRICVLKESE